MAMMSPAEFREKHARRLKEATTDMQAGVNRVTDNPMEKAAAKADKMKANLVKAIDDGKWQRGLRKVSLDDWKKGMIEKGIPRIAQGIDGAAAKVEDFASQLLPHIDKGKAAIANMPDVTLEQNIARMTNFVRHMSNFKRK